MTWPTFDTELSQRVQDDAKRAATTAVLHGRALTTLTVNGKYTARVRSMWLVSWT